MSEHRYLIDKLYKMARKLESQSTKGLSQVGETYKAENFTNLKKNKKDLA